MAWGKSSDPAASVREAAQKAWVEGRRVFTPMFAVLGQTPVQTRIVDDWALMIEATEDAGWDLEHWSVIDGSGGPQAFPVFRRPRQS